MRVKGFEINFSNAVIPYIDDEGTQTNLTAQFITKQLAYQIEDYGDYDDIEAAVDVIIKEKFLFGETVVKGYGLPYGLVLTPVGNSLWIRGFTL